MFKKTASSFGFVLLAAFAFAVSADERPDVGANLVVQAAADALREHTGADISFIGAGYLKENFSKDDLSSMLQYPADGILVLNLKGEQIRLALERSVSLHPQPNSSFLQLSGVDVVFKKNAPPNQRIVSVTVKDAPLEDGKTYTVAMPMLLARGGLGYFKYWDAERAAKTFPDTTFESVLKGKKASGGTPRWSPQG